MDQHTQTQGQARARSAAARAARDARVRLLAILARRTSDLALAEDALSEAFALALEDWTRNGVPDNPEAWLVTAARRRLIDALRAEAAASRVAESASRLATGAVSQRTRALFEAIDMDAAQIPDERLSLLFLCAHPAIEETMHTPLMLQSVLRVPAATIASLFLVSPSAMAQRLVRVKESIRGQAPRFEPPTPTELSTRLGAVLGAVYGAFTVGLDHVTGDVTGHVTGHIASENNGPSDVGQLADEALWLGYTLAELLPDEPEVLGLLALMLFADSRRDARRAGGADGAGVAYVPLSEQDPGRWDRERIDEAERVLARAATMGRLGRLQIEAAIQSAHASRLRTGRTDWHSIEALYAGLTKLAPSIGASVAHAAAVRETSGDLVALHMLDQLDASDGRWVRAYQPYWATRAAVCAALGREDEARHAWSVAIGMTDSAPVRRWLMEQQTRQRGQHG